MVKPEGNKIWGKYFTYKYELLNNDNIEIDVLGLALYIAKRVAEGVKKGVEVSKKRAIEIVRKGGDILADSRKEAIQLAKDAIRGNPMKHPDGHLLPNGKVGLPHFILINIATVHISFIQNVIRYERVLCIL